MTEVTAKEGKEGTPLTVDYDFGESIDDMVDKFGDEVVFNNAKANMIVSLQGVIRTGLKAGKDAKEIKESAAAWVPGVRKAGKSPQEKLREQFANLDPEAKKELLKELASGGS